ncbi:MAG: LysR family transcriptional regulator [Gammaproteobacteria bacterium]|nr:hydrogen peroxide-inducible genes activator [Gammaproteobacteria bacterium PRO8]MCL4778325.1 LysR family transcriptional regulator [Gammaproteobacteria bacterium]
MARARNQAAKPRHLPTVRQLRYFVTLERLGHFGRAAAACCVSQSAFSVAIRELETLLGISLVERSNRRVTITPSGHDIATQARLCLGDIESLVEMAQERRQALSGPLRLGVIPTIAPFLLPAALPRLRRKFPALQLFIREGLTGTLLDELAQGTLDLLLVALPHELPGAEVMPLFHERFLLACREDTRLTDPQHFLVNRLAPESILLLEEGHCMRDHALAACRLRSRGRVSPFAASSLHTLLEMVDGDLGISFVPEMAAGSALLRHTRVRTWPLPGGAGREIALCWRRRSARGADFRQLGELFRQARPQAG